MYSWEDEAVAKVRRRKRLLGLLIVLALAACIFLTLTPVAAAADVEAFAKTQPPGDTLAVCAAVRRGEAVVDGGKTQRRFAPSLFISEMLLVSIALLQLCALWVYV